MLRNIESNSCSPYSFSIMFNKNFVVINSVLSLSNEDISAKFNNNEAVNVIINRIFLMIVDNYVKNSSKINANKFMQKLTVDKKHQSYHYLKL